MDNKLFGIKTAIEESEKYLKEQFENVDSFKSSQGRILTSMSLIISVFGFLLSQSTKNVSVSPINIFCIGALFTIIVGIHSFSIMPISLKAPIAIEWDIFEDIFFNQNEKTVLENKIENYIKAIDDNRKIISKLIWRSRISVAAYLIILVDVFIIFCKLFS